jgi:hypothetical protein
MVAVVVAVVMLVTVAAAEVTVCVTVAVTVVELLLLPLAALYRKLAVIVAVLPCAPQVPFTVKAPVTQVALPPLTRE